MRFPPRLTRGTGPAPVRRPSAVPRWAARPQAEAEAERAGQALLRPGAAVGPVTGRAPEPDPAGAARLPGPGRPLEPVTRGFYERRLGADLRRVRVHDGPAAVAAAAEQHARGYTVGEHVVLGGGADPQLLAHELVHVLQQRRAGRPVVQRQEQPTRPQLSGVGRNPPDVDFTVPAARPSSEDAHVLFRQDSISLAQLDLSKLQARLEAATGPLLVHLDGYASNEGDQDYNLNLSAHRAAAVRAALLPLLPDGSEVKLYAHGATAEFGGLAGNRRVGIRFEELPAQPVPPTGIPSGLARRLRLVPDLELRIDPGSIPLPPGALPPIPPLRLDESWPGPVGAGTIPRRPYRPPPALPPPIPPPVPVGGTAGAAEPFRPELFRLTPRPELVDWGKLRQTFTDHGAGAISPRLAADAAAFTSYWYYHYRSLGLPHERALSLANFGTRLTVGTELAKEGNTAADRIDNELRQHGLPTPIGGTVDVLDLWRKARDWRARKKKPGGGGR